MEVGKELYLFRWY